MKGSQSDGSFILEAAGSIALTCRSNRIQQQRKRMKRILAKVEANRKEDPSSEPGSDPNTWLIEARLEEDIPDWESAQLHFESPGVEAEIIEVTISEPTRFTVRTRGESPLKKGDVIHVDVR
jgi:hypothetical protein